MFTPLLWALGKDLVQGGQRQNTIDQMQLWGFILSTPTIASDKYYRNWNVWREKDTILANYWHGLTLCRSWNMYVFAHSTTESYAYNVVLTYINSGGIFSSLKGLTDVKSHVKIISSLDHWKSKTTFELKYDHTSREREKQRAVAILCWVFLLQVMFLGFQPAGRKISSRPARWRLKGSHFWVSLCPIKTKWLFYWFSHNSATCFDQLWSFSSSDITK